MRSFSANLLTLGFSYIVKGARPCKTKYGPKIVLRIVLPMWETIEILSAQEELASTKTSSAGQYPPSKPSTSSTAIEQQIIVDSSDDEESTNQQINNQQIAQQMEEPHEQEVIDVFLPSRYTQFFTEENIIDFNS